MYFLASTLNVELVYIILTGLTQCLHIKKGEKIEKLSDNVTIKSGETKLTAYIKNIQVDHIDRWSKGGATCLTDLISNERVDRRKHIEKQIIFSADSNG